MGAAMRTMIVMGGVITIRGSVILLGGRRRGRANAHLEEDGRRKVVKGL
jgi:hypothetical protein